jgi:predicted metalloprotease
MCIRIIIALLITFPISSHADDQYEILARDAFSISKNFMKSNSANPPNLEIFTSSTGSKCGKITASGFCPADNKIYLEKNQLKSFAKIDPVAVYVIVAHEYAHAMQSRFRFGRSYTVLNELQADCLAGAYLSGKFKSDDVKIKNALRVAWSSGDFKWRSEQHHGFPHQRTQAFIHGMAQSYISKENGVLSCLDLF